MESRSRIMMLDLPGGDSHEFTQGDKDTVPKFSPDGRTLAFLRPDDTGKRQVWRMEAGGGEARSLTNAPGGVTEFSWSPNGQRLVICADVDPEASDEDTGSIPKTRVVRRIRYRYDTVGWRGDAHHHLFIVEADTDGLTVLDVRQAHEFDDSHIEGAVNIPLHELLGRLDDVPTGQVWVHCGSGYRASIAASLIESPQRTVVLVDDQFDNAGKHDLVA